MSREGSNTNNILILGAGELGSAVLRALAERRGSANEIRLTVLLRPKASAERLNAGHRKPEALQASGVHIIHADLATEATDALATMFARFSTVICCTGFVGGSGTQRKITAAVLQAGVQRYIPWQFGVDYDAIGRGSPQTLWDEQLDVRDTLRMQSRTTWTIISTGIFTSFLFEPSYGVVDLAHNRVNALGAWNNKVTVTTSDDIGMLTAEIVTSKPRVDGIVYVAGDTLSYAEIADTVSHVLNRPIERVLWTVDHLRAEVAAHPSDEIRKYRLAFAREGGVSWPKESTFNAERGIALTDVSTWLRATLRT